MELKQQIITGVAAYARNEIMPTITDEQFKFILSAALAALEVNPALVDSVFDNELVRTTCTDMQTLERILKKTLQECGSYTLVIPAIKFVLPHEQILKFSEDDVATLFKYVRSVG